MTTEASSTVHEGEYEPIWLTQLRDEDPEAAASFVGDPRRVTRLDKMLAGIMNPERKVEMIRLAYNSGFDPNDALFNFVIGALNIQQLFGKDHETYLDASRAMADEARKALGELRLASGRVDGNIEFLNEVVEGLPEQLRAWLDTAIESANSHLQERAKTETAIRLSEEARIVTAEVEQNLKQVADLVTQLRESMKPALVASQQLTRDTTVILGGIKCTKREVRLVVTALLFGIVFGGMGMGWMMNATGIGISPLVEQEVRLGRTYAAVYKSFPDECRAYVDRWAAKH